MKRQDFKPVPTDSYVDLGLPSGTLWSSLNIGATLPSDFGCFFSIMDIRRIWETAGHHFLSFSKSNLTSRCVPYSDLPFGAFGMDLFQLPTYEQVEELMSNCKWSVANRYDKGIRYIEVSSKSNGRSIFFPAAGVYDGDLNEGVFDPMHYKSKYMEGCYWIDDDEGRLAPLGWKGGNFALKMKKTEVKTTCVSNKLYLPVRPVKQGTARKPVFVYDSDTDMFKLNK